jgi:hypothetical protein
MNRLEESIVFPNIGQFCRSHLLNEGDEADPKTEEISFGGWSLWQRMINSSFSFEKQLCLPLFGRIYSPQLFGMMSVFIHYDGESTTERVVIFNYELIFNSRRYDVENMRNADPMCQNIEILRKFEI